MAKTDNFFNISGKMGEMIFYIRNGKTFVKPYSGGFTKKETQNHPKVRVAQERFAKLAHFVKSFKQGLLPYLWRQKDGSFHNQLMAIFSQISKLNPEQSFEKILEVKANYQSLKNKSLNKNSKIDPITLAYNPENNTLSLGYLPYQLSEKHKGMFLEIAMGWYGVNQGQAQFSEPVMQYIKLDVKNPSNSILLDFPVGDSTNAFLPFVSIAIVYQGNPESPSPHPTHTLTACFV
jgi:hypothetical protein